MYNFFNASSAVSTTPRSGRNKFGIKQLPMDEPAQIENPKLWAEGDRKVSRLSYSPSTFISGYYAKQQSDGESSCSCSSAKIQKCSCPG